MIKWCEAKRSGGKLDKLHVEAIREYYSNIVTQDELGQALDWFTEHLFDDYSVTLKYTLPSGQTLAFRNYDHKAPRYASATASGSRC